MTMPLVPARPGWRTLAVGAAAALGASALPVAADAHVRVHPDRSTAGSFSALTFRVPTESDTASTTQVQVELPQDKPFLYVSTKPVPGWTATVREETLPQPVDAEGTTITKAVRTVTWTASKGAEIKPGEYQEFAISAGPLPEPGRVLLPARQSYSDGSEVRWDQPTPPSGEEPEHPAPELIVTAAEAEPSAPTSLAEGEPPQAASTTDATARGLGIAGFVVGAAGLGLAALSWRRRSAGGSAA